MLGKYFHYGRLIQLTVLLALAILVGGCGSLSTPKEYTVSGQVTEKSSGNGVAGVKIAFSNSVEVVASDNNGKWSKSGLRGLVTITPAMEGWSFDPASREVTNGGGQLDFTAIPNTYAVAGKVLDTNGKPAPDVTIAFSDGSAPAISGVDGYWSKSGLADEIVITPSKDGWSFIPATAQVSSSTSGLTFVGAADPNSLMLYRTHLFFTSHYSRDHVTMRASTDATRFVVRLVNALGVEAGRYELDEWLLATMAPNISVQLSATNQMVTCATADTCTVSGDFALLRETKEGNYTRSTRETGRFHLGFSLTDGGWLITEMTLSSVAPNAKNPPLLLLEKLMEPSILTAGEGVTLRSGYTNKGGDAFFRIEDSLERVGASDEPLGGVDLNGFASASSWDKYAQQWSVTLTAGAYRWTVRLLNSYDGVTYTLADEAAVEFTVD